MSLHKPSRRRFLQATAAATVAGPLLLSSQARGANDRINLGFIGVGTMGRGHLGGFLGRNQVQVVAVCDVVAERRDNAKKMVEDRYAKKNDKGAYKGCDVLKDFRELLARKDIDAVVIATPDHWHAIQCLLACQAKKDIYCEKPLTHSIAEGRRIVDAVKKNNIVFQTGSQQRSEFGNRFRTAVELVRNGRVGKLKTVRIGVGGPAVACNLPAQEVPEGTDWNMWQGPAPERPYNEALCPKGVHNHFPAWRNYREYAGGGLADMGAHHFDIAQWALDMDNSGPVKIIPPEGKENNGCRFLYANGVEMIHGGPADCTFEGSDGIIYVSRNRLDSKPEEIVKTPIGESEFHVYKSSNHQQNWLDCVKSRKDPICTAEIGHRSATVCHLGQIAYELRRTLVWDPVKEQFANDAEANERASIKWRAPWKVEG